MAVLKTSFRFAEINLGFVTSARGAGHLTPKKSLGRGHLTKERARMVGNLTKKKCQMPWAQPGGGAWALLDLTHTLLNNYSTNARWIRAFRWRTRCGAPDRLSLSLFSTRVSGIIVLLNTKHLTLIMLRF